MIEFVHPEDEETKDHVIRLSACSDKVAIACSCGIDMSIMESPSGDIMMKSIKRMVGHFTDVGFTIPMAEEEYTELSMRYGQMYDALHPEGGE